MNLNERLQKIDANRTRINARSPLTADELREWFVPGCYAVKRGALREGGKLLGHQASALFARGAQKLVLACTEVPVALEAVRAPFLHLTYDPSQALAERCSSLWQAYQ